MYDVGPQGLNRYSYALNNPMRYTDPTGHMSNPFSWLFQGLHDSPVGQLIGNRMRDEAQGVAHEVQHQLTPPEHDTGIAEGSVPIWGDGKDAYFAAQEGKVLWASLYGFMALNDVIDGGMSPEDMVKPGIRAGKELAARTITTSGLEEQLEYLMKTIPDLDKEQVRYLLESAYKRNSTVVFGGSRIRGNYRPDSDLDVGFGSLSKSQARKVLDKASQMNGGLSLEKTLIIPGNETRVIPKIASPEEFFQRSGTRIAPDPKAGEMFTPSGSITVSPDGKIMVIPPGASL